LFLVLARHSLPAQTKVAITQSLLHDFAHADNHATLMLALFWVTSQTAKRAVDSVLAGLELRLEIHKFIQCLLCSSALWSLCCTLVTAICHRLLCYARRVREGFLSRRAALLVLRVLRVYITGYAVAFVLEPALPMNECMYNSFALTQPSAMPDVRLRLLPGNVLPHFLLELEGSPVFAAHILCENLASASLVTC
jgi:hypothetical protein